MKRTLNRETARRLTELSDEQIRTRLDTMTEADLRYWLGNFGSWAHEGQLPPQGSWRTWLMLAGRGYGKTRAGSEWVADLLLAGPARVALVAATIDEARAIMVEGEAGLLAALRKRRKRFLWEPSLRQLRIRNGSVATLYSGENPDGLRGGTHHYAWCDELAKWAKPQESWDNLQMSLRAGLEPRALVTTTPRSLSMLVQMRAAETTVTTGGKTVDNVVLEDAFQTAMQDMYGGTRLGRQELEGVLFEDAEGALCSRALLDRARSERVPDLVRVVVAVDPPASASGDACGIMVVGLGQDRRGYVLADATVSGLSPLGWAAAVSRAARHWSADRVVAEVNNGGDMVTALLRQVDPALPVKAVHAVRGKSARAEPVAGLYEQGRVSHLEAFPELEDQLCGMLIGGGYQGPGRSPDRAGASRRPTSCMGQPSCTCSTCLPWTIQHRPCRGC